MYYLNISATIMKVLGKSTGENLDDLALGKMSYVTPKVIESGLVFP